jgi:hypothetical protein
MDLSDPNDREALELFIKLERDRPHPKVYNDAEHQLAKLLGLTAEWWNGCSVSDNGTAPDCPSHLVRYQNWFRVHAVRNALLEAAKKLQAEAAE